MSRPNPYTPDYVLTCHVDTSETKHYSLHLPDSRNMRVEFIEANGYLTICGDFTPSKNNAGVTSCYGYGLNWLIYHGNSVHYALSVFGLDPVREYCRTVAKTDILNLQEDYDEEDEEWTQLEELLEDIPYDDDEGEALAYTLMDIGVESEAAFDVGYRSTGEVERSFQLIQFALASRWDYGIEPSKAYHQAMKLEADQPLYHLRNACLRSPKYAYLFSLNVDVYPRTDMRWAAERSEEYGKLYNEWASSL